MMQPSKCSASKMLRKLEKPRPPKWLLGSSMVLTSQVPLPTEVQPSSPQPQADVGDCVLHNLECLVRNLVNDNVDMSTSTEILKVCHDLKTNGPTLDARNLAQLDRCFVELRNAAGDERFDPVCRLRLLEIIELRSMGWKFNDKFELNYKNKMAEVESIDMYAPCVKPTYSIGSPSLTHDAVVGRVEGNVIASPSAEFPTSGSNQTFLYGAIPNAAPVSVLGPGEVMKTSGKYVKPTLIPIKNHYKDEVIIRNSDSGKVMGMKGRRVHMIEELSGTIVSFQRVIPGAKDRLVQLTGPSEKAVGLGKSLIEETIRRNVSPIREAANPIQMSKSSINLSMDRDNQPKSLAHSLSMNDAIIGEYQYTVTVGRDTLKLSGPRLEIVKVAKIVLEEYFAGDAKRTLHEIDDDDNDNDSLGCFNQWPPQAAINTSVNVTTNTKQRNDGSGLIRSSSLASMPLRSEVEICDSGKDGKSAATQNGATATGSNCELKDGRKIAYDRSRLLQYSLSPYSRATPKDMPKIINDMPTILKKTPHFFDPEPFRNLDLSTSSVILSNGKYRSQSKGSGSSQDTEEVET